MEGVGSPSYWVQVFTVETWEEFLQAGATTTGFSDSRWGWVKKLKPGDFLLCYLTRVSRWVGVLEVVSEPYLDVTNRIWKTNSYPCRVDVRITKALDIDQAIPIRQLADRLSIFQGSNWSLWLMASPKRWKDSDAVAVIDAIQERAKARGGP